MEGRDPSEPEGGAQSAAEGVGDALRAAVERTLAATADSATETRQRAQGLLDDVVRRGQVAREEVTRRSESASARLADAIGELRVAGDADRDRLDQRLGEIERRLGALERRIHAQPDARPEAERTRGEPLRQPDSEA